MQDPLVSTSSESSPSLARQPVQRSSKRVKWLACAVILLGLGLRLYPILWGSMYDEPELTSLHADEPKIVRYIDEFPGVVLTASDYRYPTFLHNTYGAVWAVVRQVASPPRVGPSAAGTPSYERALLMGRGLNVLLFGLGGSLLLWSFTRRLGGPVAALAAVAILNALPWWVSSTALVQTDIPMAIGLLLVFHLLLRVEQDGLATARRALGIGAAIGAAAAMKYTGAVAALAVPGVVVALALRRRIPWRSAFAFVAFAALASIAVFLFFVPAVVIDWAEFATSIRYEYRDKLANAPTAHPFELGMLFRAIPAWALVAAVIGTFLAFARGPRVTLMGLGLVLGLLFASSLVTFRPDYAMPLAPFVAAFGGVAVARVTADGKRTALAIAAGLALAVGHGWVAYVVFQRYAADTRIQFLDYARAELPRVGIGWGPSPTRIGFHSPRLPAGTTTVSVESRPEWIVLEERGYKYILQVIDGTFHVRGITVDPANRILGNATEQDFRFYEDVLLGFDREFHYDVVKVFEPRDLPLDMQGETIQLLRRRPGAAPPNAARSGATRPGSDDGR